MKLLYANNHMTNLLKDSFSVGIDLAKDKSVKLHHVLYGILKLRVGIFNESVRYITDLNKLKLSVYNCCKFDFEILPSPLYLLPWGSKRHENDSIKCNYELYEIITDLHANHYYSTINSLHFVLKIVERDYLMSKLLKEHGLNYKVLSNINEINDDLLE